jgi:parallel beta-helix repeat protein
MKSTLLFFLTVIFIVTNGFAQENNLNIDQSSHLKKDDIGKVVHPTKVSQAIFHDVIPSLKDLPTVGADYYIENKDKSIWMQIPDEGEGADYSNFVPMGEDPVWQKEHGDNDQPKGLLQNFAGQSSPYYPSDCNGTVGPNHYMQTVNTTYAIYNKTGTLLAGPTAMNLLFAGVPGASYNDGDPLILYDEQAGKWLAVEFVMTAPYYMLVALSQTNDPTGSWDRWSFPMNGAPDYEKIGIQSDGYFLSTNTYTGDDVYVFERSVMISGGSSPQMLQFENPNRPNPSGFNCIMPIDGDGTFNSSSARYIAINDNAWGGSVGGGDELWIFDCVPNWTIPLSSTFSRSQVINVGAFDSQFNSWGTGDIAQTGTTRLLDAIPYVLMTRGQYKNVSGHEYIVCNHTVDVDATNHAGIRWYQLEKVAGNWSIKQQGTYAPDSHSRWMGSIAMNNYGQIALTYSVSSSSMSPQIRYTGQTSCGTPGVLDVTEQTVTTSLTPQSQTAYTRWGDYFLTTVDPIDNLTFWSSMEYFSSGKKTQIFSFKIDESCFPPSITNVSPTSLFEDRGKQITITGTNFLGCTFTLGGVTGSVVSNDGSTAVIAFPAGNYTNGTLTVANVVGNDTETITVNTRNTIPVVSGSVATSDNHPTIESAVDGLFAWYGTTAFNAGETPGTKTIEVDAGTYTEGVSLTAGLNPTVANPLIIQNQTGEVVVVNATGNAYGFDLNTVDYVQLKGFTVYGATTANIYAQGDNNSIQFNKCYNSVSGAGIMIQTGTTNTVSNNLVYGNLWGVHVLSSNSNTIKNITANDNGGFVSGTPVNMVTQGFNAATIPAGWSTEIIADLGTNPALTYVATSTFPTVSAPAEGTYFVKFNSYNCPNGSEIRLRQSASFSTTSYSNIQVNFSWFEDTGYSTYLSEGVTVQWSTNGTSWNDATFYQRVGSVNGWVSKSCTLPVGASNQATLYIAFKFHSQYGNNCHLDNVVVKGSPNVSSGAALYVESGTGNTIQNNIWVAKTGNNAYYALKSATGVTVASSYNTYYTTNTNLFDYNGTIGNTGPIGTGDITTDPQFVNAPTDFHLKSQGGSYTGGTWPPITASGGTWTFDASTSPAIDAGNTADGYGNEPEDNGNRINQGSYGNTAQASKSAIATVTIAWDGSAGSNWQTLANWTPEQIPTASDNVTIPLGCSNYPVINNGIGTPALCNNLTISGGSVTVAPDGYMTVAGSITNSVGVAGLVIQSTDAGTGSLIQNSSGDVNATVQCRLSSTSRQWHMVSAPVTAAAFTVFPSQNSLFYYNEGTDDYWTGTVYDAGSVSGWTAPSGNMVVGKGYSFNYFASTLIYTGILNNNTSTSVLSVPYTNHGVTAGNGANYDNFDGWNLIGNPYTSAIDWDNASVDHAGANLLDAVYTYDDETLHNYTSYVGGTGTNGGTRYIPAMQGFFVKGAATELGGTLNIGANARVHNAQSYWKGYNETPENFIRLEVNGNGYKDETVVRMMNGATEDLDNGMDAFKFFTMHAQVPQIYTRTTGDVDYSINTVSILEEGNLSIPIRLMQTGETYTIRVSEFNFNGIKVYLKDNYNSKITEIGLDDVIELSANESDATDRFELVFEKSGSSSVVIVDQVKAVIYPNPNTGSFYVTVGNGVNGYEMEVTTITGQLIYKNTFEDNFTKEIKLNAVNAGVYFVKIRFEDGSELNRKIIVNY